MFAPSFWRILICPRSPRGAQATEGHPAAPERWGVLWEGPSAEVRLEGAVLGAREDRKVVSDPERFRVADREPVVVEDEPEDPLELGDRPRHVEPEDQTVVAELRDDGLDVTFLGRAVGRAD